MRDERSSGERRDNPSGPWTGTVSHLPTTCVNTLSSVVGTQRGDRLFSSAVQLTRTFLRPFMHEVEPDCWKAMPGCVFILQACR
jgi:hypothetical protein